MRTRLIAVAVAAGFGFGIGILTPAARADVQPLLQLFGIILCSRSGPCQEGKNAGTGAGLEGISAKGKGLVGQTTFASTSSSNGQAGVLGMDVSTGGIFDVGVEGTSARGIGVSGISNSTNFPGAGVSGLLGPPSGLLVFASGAVYGDSRDGSGVLATSANAAAVVAASTNSFGVNGITFNKSLTTHRGISGVIGNDSSSDGGHLNVGVSGTSTNGTGLSGSSVSGVGVLGGSRKSVGILGTTAFASSGQAFGSAGVEGLDTSTDGGTLNKGVEGTSNTGIGVAGSSTNNVGVDGSTLHKSSVTGSGASGVNGHDDSSDGGNLNVGVAGLSTNGIGVSAASSNFVGLDVVGGGAINGASDFVPSLSVVSSPNNSVAVVEVCNSPSDNPCTLHSASRIFSLDDTGSISITGLLFTSGPCSSGCVAGRNGVSRRVRSYAETQTVPSIDDFGEAQLVAGQVHVRLSADFAKVVDQVASYLVFITPEGDSRGLYVTDKTHAGFTVRENEGGRSTLAFSYRIVARPYGVHAARLPVEFIRPSPAQRMPTP